MLFLSCLVCSLFEMNIKIEWIEMNIKITSAILFLLLLEMVMMIVNNHNRFDWNPEDFSGQWECPAEIMSEY